MHGSVTCSGLNQEKENWFARVWWSVWRLTCVAPPGSGPEMQTICHSGSKLQHLEIMRLLLLVLKAVVSAQSPCFQGSLQVWFTCVCHTMHGPNMNVRSSEGFETRRVGSRIFLA